VCAQYSDTYEAAASVVATTTPTDRGTFTPGAITINAYAVKFYYTAVNPTGTFTMVLRNTTDGVDVANTSVTMNVSDLKATGTSTHLLYASWIWVPTNGNVTLTAGKTYAIRISSSVTNMIWLVGTATNVLARCLSTTTTGAPANGDTLFITGLKTGQGTNTPYTVTMKETSTTNYYGTRGTNGIYVCCNGTLAYDYQASTNYYLKVRGEIGVGSEGTLTIGTQANPIPTTSTAVLEFDAAATTDSGLFVDDYATLSIYGSSLYANGYRTRLASDHGGICNTVGTAVTRVTGQAYTGLSGTVTIAGTNYTIASVNSADSITLTGSAGTAANRIFLIPSTTSLTTTTSTGWESGDPIGIAKITQGAADYGQLTTLNGAASGTTITITDALTHHKDTASDATWQVEVMNFRRNVRLRGISTTATGYVSGKGSYNTKNITHCEFSYLGTGTGSVVTKHAVAVWGVSLRNNANGTYNISYCSAYNFGAVTTQYFIDQDTTNSGANYSYLDLWGVKLYTGTSSSLLPNFHDNIWMGGRYAEHLIYNTADQVNNCRMFGQGINVGYGGTGTSGGFYKNSYVHGSSTGFSVGFGAVNDFLIDNVHTKRCYGYGWNLSASQNNFIINNCSDTSSVNGCFSISEDPKKNIQITNFVGNVEAGYPSTYGVVLQGTMIRSSYFADCEFGLTLPHTTAEVYVADYENAEGLFYNCEFGGTPLLLVAASTESRTGINMRFMSYQKTAGDNRQYVPYGSFQTDTTIYRTTSPGVRMVPINANKKLESSTFTVPCKSGETVTASIYVRESVVGDGTDYNGNRPRLMVKANYTGGITSDTVLDTASASSEGAWEKLEGTTAAVTGDCVLEFYVDCDGTTGWINIDDFKSSPSNDSRNLTFWRLAEPYVVGNNLSGGGSSTFVG
jgi:hypothetical protein